MSKLKDYPIILYLEIDNLLGNHFLKTKPYGRKWKKTLCIKNFLNYKKLDEQELNFHSLYRLFNKKINIQYTLGHSAEGREDNNKIMSIDIMMCLQECCLFMQN